MYIMVINNSNNSKIYLKAELTAGVAARTTEQRKHEANDANSRELWWVCVGTEVTDGVQVMSGLSPSNQLKQGQGSSPTVMADFIKANATAILSRCFALACRLFHVGMSLLSSYRYACIHNN